MILRLLAKGLFRLAVVGGVVLATVLVAERVEGHRSTAESEMDYGDEARR